ncbi:MAG: hypothetical protein P8L35_01100 [Acidimicrobiales bacterium]|nr:hypothetical protein [Acidimicrobiales bacterium]
MTHLGYLLAGWGLSSFIVLLYAFRLLKRGAQLSTRVPSDQARWMSSPKQNGR